MLIIPPSLLQIDKCLRLGVQSAAIALCALVCGMLVFYFVYPWESNSDVMQEASLMQKGSRAFFPYESIGSGALALHPRPALGWVSRLADELLLVAYNSRPDIDSQQANILIALKNGKEQLTLSNGSTLFLKESEQGKGLLSSQTPTGLWVKPLLLDNGAVLIEAGRKIKGLKEDKAGEEKGQFIVVQQGGTSARYNLAQQLFAKQIKSARVFPQDLLIQKYGGHEYAAWRDRCVLELTSDFKTYACFVCVGDYLIYEEGEWHVSAYEDLKADKPVALIAAANGKTMEMDVWDDMGFYPLHVKLEMQNQAHLQLKTDAMPSGVRLRSGTQVSCAFGKRRMILRQGDWLLKTSSGWRNLRRTEEIEQYLHHRLKGELLIFDGIEKEQGRSVMKGHIFDETRTHMQALMLPVDPEKSQGKTSGKRKPILPTANRRAA